MAEVISMGPFATAGERKAAEQLQQLPAHWLVISNKVLPTQGGRSYEIDFIVVGKRWIFVIDEKSWSGKVRGNEDLWIKADGSSEYSPLAKANMVAKILAGRLRKQILPLDQPDHFVRSGVLLSAMDHLPQINDMRATHGIFLLEQVCQHLMTLDSQGGNPQVGQVHNLIKKALVGLEDRPQIPHNIFLYTIHDATQLRPGVRLFHATMEGLKDVSWQLMLYELGKDPLAAQQQRDFYLQEFKALNKLRPTGLVPEADSPFLWSDEAFLVVPIKPTTGKPLSAWPLPETREEFIQDLKLAATSFQALGQIHAQGVLHRALGPETLLIQSMQPPKVVFTNFYAARVDNESIAVTLDTLSVENPYAYEDLIIGYGYATPQSDTFSLALIFLERLSGVPISHLRSSIDSPVLFPDQPRWSSFLSAEQSRDLTLLLQAVLTPQKGEATPSAKAVGDRLQALSGQLRVENSTAEGRLLLGGNYKVHRILGQGAMARTYLVSHTNLEMLGVHVLKQFLHPISVYNQAIAEYQALRKVKSKYLPTIEDIFKPEDEAHIKMEYIPGPTLQQIEAEFPWPLERWWQFTQDLLNAIEELEQHQLLHRDIKPANIILHETGNYPVLIDFGFAIEQGSTSQVAGTPLYLPPEAITATQPPPSSDRYAAGIVLFKALTGLLPFQQSEQRQRHLISVEQIVDQKVRRLARVLLRTIAPDPTERQATLAQLRNELQTAILAVDDPAEEEVLEEQTNPWVDNIRGLYRNSSSGNADNRGLDSHFVKETYVPTALDQKLLPALLHRRPCVVFLSGNPGDGKTAFLEQVQQTLQQLGAQMIMPRTNASGWEWCYDGHTFRSCYDASESHNSQSADEQLTEKLQGMEGDSRPDVALTVLVAINDGRLADFFSNHQARFGWLTQQLAHTHEEEDEGQPDIWVVDLKKRAFVNLPESGETSIFGHVLQRLVAKEQWEACHTCAARAICPIFSNATELSKKRLQQRLEFLFLLAHLRRQRHITMRDLRSALAYLITSNLSCEQVHTARKGEDAGSSLVNFSYWQSAFAPIEEHDELLKDLLILDPARSPHPHLDRFLHFHQTTRDAEGRRQLFLDKTDLPVQRFKQETAWISAFKRRMYFYGGKPDPTQAQPGIPQIHWLTLLPYQHAIKYLKLLDERIKPERLLELIALGILRSSGITGDVPSRKFSVVVRASTEQQLVVLKQLPLEEFTLRVHYPQGAGMIEAVPESILLEHHSGTPRLEISLDLFELLMRLADGLQPSAPEFRPLLDDLALFKNALLLQETQDLVLIENNYRVHHITQEDGKIIRKRVQ